VITYFFYHHEQTPLLFPVHTAESDQDDTSHPLHLFRHQTSQDVKGVRVKCTHLV